MAPTRRAPPPATRAGHLRGVQALNAELERYLRAVREQDAVQRLIDYDAWYRAEAEALEAAE